MVNTWEERRLLGMAHFILSNQTEAKERRLTMDECITKEMTKSLLKAFEGMNESLEDFQKACASTIESTEKHIVSALFLRESAMLIKLAESSFVTRWYYKHKYREAKYHRIKAERFFQSKFQVIC